MRRTGHKGHGVGCEVAVIRTLVISQHEAVRRQLVMYLSRSPMLSVHGEPFTPGAIVDAQPDVLVLDLSRLGPVGLRQALEASQLVGARLVALASMYDPADQLAVIGAGGLYRLKSAGEDGLAEVVRDVASRPAPCLRQPAPIQAITSNVGRAARGVSGQSPCPTPGRPCSTA